MSDRVFRLPLILAASLALLGLPAFAQGRGHKERGARRNELRGEQQRDNRRVAIRSFRERDERFAIHDDDEGREFDRDDDRDDVFGARHRVRVFSPILFPDELGPSRRPPGWDRGRKVGWGDCDVPPGLAKKEGCSSVFGRRRIGRQRRFRRGLNPVVVIVPARRDRD